MKTESRSKDVETESRSEDVPPQILIDEPEPDTGRASPNEEGERLGATSTGGDDGSGGSLDFTACMAAFPTGDGDSDGDGDDNVQP